MLFLDESALTVGPNSDVVLDEFEPARSNSSRSIRRPTNG